MSKIKYSLCGATCILTQVEQMKQTIESTISIQLKSCKNSTPRKGTFEKNFLGVESRWVR